MQVKLTVLRICTAADYCHGFHKNVQIIHELSVRLGRVMVLSCYQSLCFDIVLKGLSINGLWVFHIPLSS